MDVFSELEQALAAGSGLAAADLLIERLEQEHRWPEWFQARLLRKRLEPGSEEGGQVYDAFQIETARETGMRLLQDGQIARAWSYFRALGEHQPMIDAIEKLKPDQFTEEILSIAFQERLNPQKALALVLATSGICRAITVFDQYPDPATWEQSLHLLTQALYNELEQNLKAAIARREGSAPEVHSLGELIAGRGWLFGEYDSYVDASHLYGILRLCLDSTNPETLRMALDMAGYGACLSSNFQTSNPPPFEDFVRDHAIYLRALLGEDVDSAVAHFRKKAEASDPEKAGTFPAEVLVRFLLRLGRPRQAVEIFERFLMDRDPAFLTCPDLPELCRQAGDFRRLQALSRERDDPVGFLQAALAAHTGKTAP